MPDQVGHDERLEVGQDERLKFRTGQLLAATAM